MWVAGQLSSDNDIKETMSLMHQRWSKLDRDQT